MYTNKQARRIKFNSGQCQNIFYRIGTDKVITDKLKNVLFQ
jgi:hypothetical protein